MAVCRYYIISGIVDGGLQILYNKLLMVVCRYYMSGIVDGGVQLLYNVWRF